MQIGACAQLEVLRSIARIDELLEVLGRFGQRGGEEPDVIECPELVVAHAIVIMISIQL